MKKEDLEIDMVIEREYWRDRTIKSMGDNNYWYAYEYGEDADSLAYLEDWSPKQETPELYYIWRICNLSNWFMGGSYLAKNGLDSSGEKRFTTWDELERHICTEFKPITKDGKVWEG